jgi:putative selenium metabolism hydrolase
MNRNERLVELCQGLIRIPSLSGQEGALVQKIKETMVTLGFDDIIIDRYGSITGCLKGKRPGVTLLMDGHIDTVDVPERNNWHHDPFSADIEDGKIFGRGTSDMKGSVAAMIIAAASFAKDRNRDFAGKICVSCSVHEECFEGVATREITKNIKPDFVVVGEATSTTLKIGQRGRAELVIETEGKTCHSSNPDKGVNAVYHMLEIIQEIRNICVLEHPILGKGILELTDIISAPYPGSSIVPGYCRATFDRRTIVGENEDSILGQIEDVISSVRDRIPELKARVFIAEGNEKCWTGETIEAKRFFPAWLLNEGNAFVQAVREGLFDAGINAPISTFSFCTNGSHFCGEAGIPTVGFGPSLESLAHITDEYIEIQQLTSACEGFYGILSKIMGVDKTELL